LKMGGISQGFGEATKVEIPDPNQYGSFIEVDSLKGTVERASFTLSGRFAATMKSRLLAIAKSGKACDVQLHVGDTTDPTSFNIFSKAIIAEGATATQHSTEDLGALESGENAIVGESADLSAIEYFEVVPLSFASKVNELITNGVKALTILEGGAQVTSELKVFACTAAAGGSPGTPADVLASMDGGATWKAHDVDGFAATDDCLGIAGVGDYIVVVSNTGAGLALASVQDFVDGLDPVFAKVTTGFVAAGKPNAISSVGRRAFIVGDAGYVYYTEDPAAGVTTLDAGSATVDKLLAVSALDEDNAIAVGNNGAVIVTTDRYSWTAVQRPIGVTFNLLGCFMKSKTEWWVTCSNGKVYYTVNAGKTWTDKPMPGTVPTSMKGITFGKATIGYACGLVAGKGRLYRSFDGGYSWVVLPESIGSMPTATDFCCVTAPKLDANLVFTAGLNSADGVLVIGKA
jgi:photosystem II stability/assembly factor-like uncharacterized protein